VDSLKDDAQCPQPARLRADPGQEGLQHEIALQCSPKLSVPNPRNQRCWYCLVVPLPPVPRPDLVDIQGVVNRFAVSELRVP